ncbi:TonB-dependent receptor [Solimonas terrae]|nr:TonB-dependent receptor [Solimonas terrae]
MKSHRFAGSSLLLVAVMLSSVAWAQDAAPAPVAEQGPQPGPATADDGGAAASTGAASTAAAPTAPDANLDVIAVPSAQTVTTPATEEPATNDAQIAEVVVTATKRAQPVREIPATIAVLSGEKLEREGVQNIEQIVAMVPGVNLTDEGTGGTPKRVTIRGISAGTGTNLTTGTLIGDIPFSDPFAPKVQLDPNPFDIATVEVLKGPQGTLFGGTGLNGMIRYVPEAPELDRFHVKYYTQFASYPGNGDSGWNYGAMINVPFADNTAALRLVGFHRDQPGYVDDTYNDRRDVNSALQYGLRGILAWQPDERWKISLMGAMQRTDDYDLSYADNPDGRLEHGNSPRPSPGESRYVLGNLAIERDFDWGDVISQTSYVQKNFNIFLEASRAVGGQLPLLSGADDNHSKSVIQELRAVSAPDDGPWKWLAGAFYYDMNLYDCAEAGAAQDLPTLPVPEILNGLLANPCPGNAGKLSGQLDIAQLLGDLELQEQALFGELTREFGEHWEATLGARAYRIRTTGTVSFAGLIYALQNNLMAGEHSGDASENGISPKASIVYHPSKDLRFYFTASRGFRFGGPQLASSTPTTKIPETYKSDSLWNYELGVRSDWFRHALIADASIYLLDWKNAQVYQMTSPPVSIGYLDNVGGARGKGAEVSLSYLPPFLDGLSLDVAASWNRTRTTAAFTAGDGTVVPVGSPWPLAPRWQTSTTLAYVQPVLSWQLGASVRHTYLGDACNTITCTARVFGYQTWDVNLFATPDEGSYWPQLSVTLANLTDKRGFSNITTNPAPAGDTYDYIAPRSLVLRLSGNF